MDDRESLVKIGKILDSYTAAEIKDIVALLRIAKVMSESGAWE